MKRAYTMAMLLGVTALPWLSVLAQSAEREGPLELRIALSKQTVLLGEPVWIDVSAANRSREALGIAWGLGCVAGAPLVIEVPDATPGNGEPKFESGPFCRLTSIDCLSGGLTEVRPNGVSSRRYLLQGDFHISKPGHYDVVVTKTVRWGLWSRYQNVFEMNFEKEGGKEQTETLTLSLDVLPPDAGKLLAMEQGLVAEAAVPYHWRPAPAPAGRDSKKDALEAKAWTAAEGEADFTRTLWRDAVYDGLAAHPAAGMEPVFAAWVVPSGEWIRGLRALYHLNTVEARAALARLTAVPAKKPRDEHDWMPGSIRWEAARDLSQMGDKSYVPLLEELSTDADEEVRMSTLRGLGILGGESELPFFEARLRSESRRQDRFSAFDGMANTASAKAVPLLIDAFTSPLASNDPDSSLMALTHHRLPKQKRERTPEESQFAWRTWWTVHEGSAKIFGPGECLSIFGVYPE